MGSHPLWCFSMDFDGAGHKLALACRDGMVLVVDLLPSAHESEPQVCDTPALNRHCVGVWRRINCCAVPCVIDPRCRWDAPLAAAPHPRMRT
jgi:hypothetical protein